MKYKICIAAVLAMTVSCRQTPEAPAVSSIEPDYAGARVQVEEVIDRFGRMWEDEDMVTFSEIIAHDADLVVIGTDRDEVIVGYEDYFTSRSRQFASFENVEFDVRSRFVKIGRTGNVAWFAEEYDLFLLAQDQPVSLEGLRVTGGLEKRDDKWVIVQLHTSVPIAGQAAEY